MRALLVASSLLLATASASAQDVDARVGGLRERMERVQNDRGHDAAEDALGHAARAIRAALRADREGQPGVALRALEIADAAITLADRLAARERARHALADARERKRTATRRAAAARTALESGIERRGAPP